jgi:hypothetical protein
VFETPKSRKKVQNAFIFGRFHFSRKNKKEKEKRKKVFTFRAQAGERGSSFQY